MGAANNSDDYGLNISMIGDSMYLLYLFLSRNIYTTTKSSKKEGEKKSIFDFWNFNYELNKSFEQQAQNIFNKYKKIKESYSVTNFKEVLIVHVQNSDCQQVYLIFHKLEELKRMHYMPMVLFLCDEYKKIIPDKNMYPHINPKTIFTSSFIPEKEYLYESPEKELTKKGQILFENIKNILLRFCSYYNDLGDRFSIGENDKIINFDLNERCFPFTINICCIGRFGKGKSTCVNCILNEMKARESKSGTSTTKKINYYQVTNSPIKIYDIPGFENKETALNTINKLKELNDEINELKDQIHVIIYIMKSTDERMFADLEYDVIKEISKFKSKILYVLTHSSTDTEKDEIIDMINTGLKGVLNNHENDDFLFYKMKADDKNCVLVNFHKSNNKKDNILGLNELFTKIKILTMETESYNKFSNLTKTKEEYDKKIKEEADIRKIRAKKMLQYHSIGAGAIGLIPFVDVIVQKTVIQQSAAKKIGQIFGIDIKIVEKENKSQLSNQETVEINEKSSITPEGASRTASYVSSGISIGSGVGSGIAKIVSESGTIATEASQISAVAVTTALRAVSFSFIFVGSAFGIGVGYYFMKSHCEELIEKLYNYFLKNAEKLSDSMDLAIQYLNERANVNYDDYEN